jgi:ABC-type amino acid transport substrate-binding protein
MKKTITTASLLMATLILVSVAMLGPPSVALATSDAATGEGIASASPKYVVSTTLTPAVAVAYSDGDSNPADAPVMACYTCSGRVVITGDCNWFDDTYRSLGDNQPLLLNSFSWLSLTGSNVLWIEVTNYHLQYSIDDAYYDGLKALLIANGYTVTKYIGTITGDALSGYDILAITNTATGSDVNAKTFTTSEIDAIEDFVSSGHGLFLAAENGELYGNDNFDPIGARFGVTFDNNAVRDPSNYYINTFWPIIHVFATHALTSGVSNHYHIFGCTLSGTVEHVIPEVPFGTIMASLGMIIALAGFLGFKRFRPKFQLH